MRDKDLRSDINSITYNLERDLLAEVRREAQSLKDEINNNRRMVEWMFENPPKYKVGDKIPLAIGEAVVYKVHYGWGHIANLKNKYEFLCGDKTHTYSEKEIERSLEAKDTLP